MLFIRSLVLASAAVGVGSFGALVPVPLLGATPVAAQSWWNSPSASYYRPRADASRARAQRHGPGSSQRKKPSAAEVLASKATANGPLMAVVSLGAQRMTVYDSTGPIIRSPISTGKAGHRTPTGVFSVIQKNQHHVSNIYSGAPMPYMQRITWSGIALHAGVLPGYPASAGCIRMPYPVAAKLFAMSRMGMRVIVAPHEPQATAFAHQALPEPLMVAAPGGEAGVPRAGAPGETSSLVRLAAAEGAEALGQVATRFLNPMERAALERKETRARLVVASRTNKELLEASLRSSAAANAAAAKLRATRTASEQIKARHEAAEGDARAALEIQLADAEHSLAEAITQEAQLNKAAYDAAKSSRDAEDAVADAEAAVKVADRGNEPIAVFVSRREGKVLVRQGMMPLFEAPVTFKDPGKPLGTHVFQALSADTTTGRISWTAVTVPENVAGGETFENRAPVRRGERTAPQPVGPPSDAKEALERVEMPDDVRRRISERLWVNGSIVISDQGLGNETGKGTDFIVLTR